MKCETAYLFLEDKNKKKRAFICNFLEETFTSIPTLSCRRFEVCNECSRLCRTEVELLYCIRTHEVAKIFTKTSDSLERSLLGYKPLVIVLNHKYSVGYYTSEPSAYGYLR